MDSTTNMISGKKLVTRAWNIISICGRLKVQELIWSRTLFTPHLRKRHQNFQCLKTTEDYSLSQSHAYPVPATMKTKLKLSSQESRMRPLPCQRPREMFPSQNTALSTHTLSEKDFSENDNALVLSLLHDLKLISSPATPKLIPTFFLTIQNVEMQ